MRITMKYMAQLKQATGLSTETIELECPCAPTSLVQQVVLRHGDAVRRLLLDAQGRLHPAILLFVGDEQVTPHEPHPFRENDVLTILVPMAGG
jgi:hypothetical protein